MARRFTLCAIPWRMCRKLCLFLCLLSAPLATEAAGHPRIIALHGALAEMVLALGRGDLLVARTEADAEILPQLPSIGTHLRPNLEAILALHPDVVLTLEDAPHPELCALLQAAGIRTLALPGQSFADLFASLRRLGRELDAEAQAEAQVQAMERTLAAVAAASAARRPRVLVELRYPNLVVSGTASIVHHMILAAGGENAVTAPEKIVRLSEEELLRLAPEVCVILRGPMHPHPEPLPERGPIFASLPCVRRGLVFQAEQAAFSRPTPRAVAATQQLAAWIQHAARVLEHGEP
ncbi:MAG: ABC transporter substrate-binding protein [Desulfomicrobiaceae bacterium]